MLAQILFLAAAAVGAGGDTDKFVIEARIVGAKTDLQAPKLLIDEGQSATLRDQKQRAFVTSVNTSKHGDKTITQPMITVLTEGLSLDAKVRSADEDHVSLDLTIAESKITKVEEQQINDGVRVQSPSSECNATRIFLTVRLGEKTKLPWGIDGKQSIELVVRRKEPGGSKGTI